MNIFETINEYPVILTEGAIIERIRRDYPEQLDPYILHAGMIYDDNGQNILKDIYISYLNISRRYKIPMIISAPTWRANPERISKSQYNNQKNINQDCINFMKGLRKEYSCEDSVLIAGLMACKGDAYKPEEALSLNESYEFHINQADALVEGSPDFIQAATLPAFTEAYGIAQAISQFDLPYVLSFVIRKDGCLLDGTPLSEAIDQIDNEIEPAPDFLYGKLRSSVSLSVRCSGSAP